MTEHHRDLNRQAIGAITVRGDGLVHVGLRGLADIVDELLR